MLIAVVLLGVFLIASIIGNVILFRIGENLRESNELNESRIVQLKILSDKVFQDIKEIDNREWFQKDDEVGVVFQDMVDIITRYNEIVQMEEDIDNINAEKE